MCKSLSVAWTVTPRNAPQPWIGCARCGGPRPFRSSDRFRLNANGRLLDAWLIYRCTACGATWNCPILSRRSVRDIDPALLAAFQSNNPELARRTAFDLAMLRRHALRVDICPDVDLGRRIVGTVVGGDRMLSIRIAPSVPLSLRLDRLLATGLALSRSRIERLTATGLLVFDPPSALRQPLNRPPTARLDLTTLSDAETILAAALGASPLPED